MNIAKVIEAHTKPIAIDHAEYIYFASDQQEKINASDL